MPVTPRTRPSAPSSPSAPVRPPRRVAIAGAGMAGTVCARTLIQAGLHVDLFECEAQPGGRMATLDTEFGCFDPGVQYFTVRDPRFEQALNTVPGIVRPWSANTVRVLDPLGNVLDSVPPPREPHWVAVPGMDALVRAWTEPLSNGSLPGSLCLQSRVTRIEPDSIDPKRWQLRTEAPDGAQHVHGGFDQVVLALPHAQALALLQDSNLAPRLQQALAPVRVAPCWTLMVAYPQAAQPGLPHLGPQWNAARSTHHRISWLARESSKPRRRALERWTIQASPAWSQEHLHDDPERVQAKLLKGFGEITGIRATPTWSVAHLWPQAQTLTPLGQPFLHDARLGLGLCGDWCLGHRVENAFVSGLELALAMA